MIASDRPSTKPVVFHLGVHKTASTMIQYLLLDNLDALHAQRIEHFPRPDMTVWVGFGGKMFTAPDPFVEQMRRFWADDAYDALIVSHEDTLGRPFDADRGPVYPRARRNLLRLRELAGPGQVVLVLRPQAQFIESMYLQMINTGQSYSFAQWLETIDVEQLSWQPLVDATDEVFGRENVTLLDFGAIRLGHQAFLQHFLDVLAIEVNVDTTTARTTNRSLSEKGLQMAREVNRHLSDPKDVFTVRRFLQARFSNVDYPRPILLTPDQSQSLDDRYAEEFHALVTRDAAAASGSPARNSR